jgi:hypothetical protein
MAKILHILTRADDSLARNVVGRQRESSDDRVETTDLTQEEVDYQKLLADIFEADSIQVW